MRQVKARAWCEGIHDSLEFSKPHMDYEPVLINGQYAFVDGGWDIHGVYPTVPVMYSTGLEDKNGKEIYEGDIIQNLGNVGVVGYDDDYSARYMVDDAPFSHLLEDSLEVIGNIHENPELLKKD